MAGSDAIAGALDALFSDPNIGRDAFYTGRDGASRTIRVAARRPDAVTGFGEAQIWSSTTRFDLLAHDVTPYEGDRLEMDGEVFIVQGEPVRDAERLVWTVDVREAGAP